MAENKLSIGRLELSTEGRWLVDMQNGAGGWYLANWAEIPTNKLDDGEYHLFKYNKDDQFCYFVDLEKLQEKAKAALEDLAPDGEAGGDLSAAVEILGTLATESE